MGLFNFVGDLFSGGKGAGFESQNGNPIQYIDRDTLTRASDKSDSGIQQYQAFLNAVQAQNGLGNQTNVYNQLQDVAAGRGANPAQAMLNQATGQNISNQAALMASQRGVNANPALIARQAAQTGAGIQQNAAGQGAILQANQSLNALNASGNIANNQAAQQQAAMTGYNNVLQNNTSNMLGAMAAQNQANVGNASQMNQAQAAIAAQNAKKQGDIFSGGMEGAMNIFSKMMPQGKEKQTENYGGEYGATPGNSSEYGGGLSGGSGGGPGSTMMAAEGGPVNGPKSRVGQTLHGILNTGSTMKAGGKVPGKPVVDGATNSYKNDNVKALLSPGEIVLPRSVTQSKDPVSESAKFVQAIMAKRGLQK